MKEVTIIGSGLAGITAAMDLADAGFRVHILEAHPYIGGRTSSWKAENGMYVESGLHRFLGFYSELPKQLERAGIKHSFLSDTLDMIFYSLKY